MKMRFLIGACMVVALGVGLFVLRPLDDDRAPREDLDGKLQNDDSTVTETRYPSGALEERREFRPTPDGKPGRLASYVRWSASGQKMVEMVDQDSHQSGKATFWHENGRKSVEGGFRNGKRHGKVIAWHENGKKASEGEFRDGRPHGKLVKWLEDGSKWEEGEYRDGERHGEFVLWGEDGKKTLLQYENGKLVR